MKAEVKIPKGWKKIEGRFWMRGDRYLRRTYLTWHVIEQHLIGEPIDGWETGIRRIKPKKARKA